MLLLHVTGTLLKFSRAKKKCHVQNSSNGISPTVCWTGKMLPPKMAESILNSGLHKIHLFSHPFHTSLAAFRLRFIDSGQLIIANFLYRNGIALVTFYLLSMIVARISLFRQEIRFLSPGFFDWGGFSKCTMLRCDFAATGIDRFVSPTNPCRQTEPEQRKFRDNP